ncbi:FAD dependent oxidoreductase [Obelidium mucronatum]|nr:FAD dependent oxidoreductase [Obelidium mucronatum]
MKVLVVGGGAFGLSAALSLQKRGHQVTVFDRLSIPAEDAASTDISKVIRADYASQRVYQQMALESIRIFKDEWNSDAKEKLGSELYVECGALFATQTPEMNEFERLSIASLKLDGINPKLMDKNDVTRRMGPLFANEYPHGYFNETAGFAYSGLTIQYVSLLAKQQGVKFVVGAQAGAFVELLKSPKSKDIVIGILTADGVRHFGDQVLVAAGSWTPSLIPQLEGLCSVSGQPVIHFQLPESLKPKFSRIPVWFADVSSTGFYGFPLNKRTGELKIAHHGAGFASKFHKQTKPAINSKTAASAVTPIAIPKSAVKQYRDFLGKVFPELDVVSISRTRLCWYCESWDGNFYIDAVPGLKNCFVATGGSGHGFKFVPVLGDVIANVLEGKQGDPEVKKLLGWRSKAEIVVDAIRQKGDLNITPRVLEQEELARGSDLVGTGRSKL